MKKNNEENPTDQVIPDSDPFDPANLRLDQSHLEGGAAKKLVLTVPVRKPKKQEFIRVHPEESFRLTPAATITLEEDREVYLVHPRLVEDIEQDFNFVTLFLGITRQKVLFLWPVKLPTADGRKMDWHVSALAAAEHAMQHWLKVVPNMNLGAYEVFTAIGHFPEPEWPDLPFSELLEHFK